MPVARAAPGMGTKGPSVLGQPLPAAVNLCTGVQQKHLSRLVSGSCTGVRAEVESTSAARTAVPAGLLRHRRFKTLPVTGALLSKQASSDRSTDAAAWCHPHLTRNSIRLVPANQPSTSCATALSARSFAVTVSTLALSSSDSGTPLFGNAAQLRLTRSRRASNDSHSTGTGPPS